MQSRTYKQGKMHMNYQQLLQELKDNPQSFYHILIANADVVLLEIAINKQIKVADDLQMTTSKLSIVTQILKEFSNAR